MYTFTIVAALCAGFAVAQDLAAIQGLPECGKFCINSMLAKAPGLGCPNNNIACLCTNMDFGNGVRDCTIGYCGPNVDKQSVIEVGNSFCANAVSAASGSETSRAIETAMSGTTTVASSSGSASGGAVATTTDSAGSTLTTMASGTGLSGTNGTMGTAGASGASGAMSSASGAMSSLSSGLSSAASSASGAASSGASATSDGASSPSDAPTDDAAPDSASGADRTAVAGLAGLAGIAAAVFL